MDQHELRITVSPDERREVEAPIQYNAFPPHDRRRGERQVVFRGILVEQPELVVVHSADHKPIRSGGACAPVPEAAERSSGQEWAGLPVAVKESVEEPPRPAAVTAKVSPRGADGNSTVRIQWPDPSAVVRPDP